MKKVCFLVVLFTAGVSLVSMTGITPVHARALAMTQVSAPPQSTSQTFTGTIVKTGDTFTLDDKTNKVTYTLDDTQRASQFVGKTVKVTGTLDAQTHIIHVQSIQAG